MNLKTIIFFLLVFTFQAGAFYSNAQGRDTVNTVKDSALKNRDTTKKNNRDTGISSNSTILKPIKNDTFKIRNNQETDNSKTLLAAPNRAAKDTAISGAFLTIMDTQASGLKEVSSSGSFLANTNKLTNSVLAKNRFINTKDKGTYFLQELRTFSGKEFTFYLLCILLFILAIFKTFYPMYFNNLFRIFFNTSLRQTQLTDQLSQAKFPSFILNIFFTLSAGIYIWLIFYHFNKAQSTNPTTLLISCILSVAAVYLIKFIILKFTGWIAGIQQTIDNYIFVIFLVNKIMGVLLLPFLILLAFSIKGWIPAIAVISALFIGLLFLSRYAKSYGALEKKLNINSLHLFIFVVGAEIIPLFIFYKVAVDYLV